MCSRILLWLSSQRLPMGLSSKPISTCSCDLYQRYRIQNWLTGGCPPNVSLLIYFAVLQCKIRSFLQNVPALCLRVYYSLLIRYLCKVFSRNLKYDYPAMIGRNLSDMQTCKNLSVYQGISSFVNNSAIVATTSIVLLMWINVKPSIRLTNLLIFL